MKTYITFLVCIFIITDCTSDETNLKEKYKSEGLGQIEQYDFDISDGGEKSVVYDRNDDWRIHVWAKPRDATGSINEYAPAIDFYVIVKEFHPNGMIKKRGKCMFPDLKFGKWEYFDKKGNLIRVDDEDTKFEGIEITREDMLKILELEGWFNRNTGASKIYRPDGVYPTNGEMYSTLSSRLYIGLIPALIEEGKEIRPPIWWANIRTSFGYTDYTMDYRINAHTGEYLISRTVGW